MMADSCYSTPIDEDAGEPHTRRFDQFTGEGLLVPCYVPKTGVVLAKAQSGEWRAILDVSFQGSGWMVAALGRTRREAVSELEIKLRSLK